MVLSYDIFCRSFYHDRDQLLFARKDAFPDKGKRILIGRQDCYRLMPGGEGQSILVHLNFNLPWGHAPFNHAYKNSVFDTSTPLPLNHEG